MKILVLSLLRIGDIVLMAPALRSLRDRHPEAEIHVLVNSQFKRIAPLVPYVDSFIGFDRELMQKGLGEASIPVFESYERLVEAVDDLNNQGYDWIINLTHNRLSGWMMSLLDARNKSGLCFDAQARATFGSNWFRYLNNQVDADGSEVFHFADVFRFALAGGEEISSPGKASLIETASGRAEAEAFVNGRGAGGMIAVQALTSDGKKDWGLERFAEAIERIQRTQPDAFFAIVGAPFERDRLEPLAARLKAAGVRAELAILSFEGAFSLMKMSRLLLTGDTSVKHLAAAARTPIVEISIGSSDFYRTGAYAHGSVIVQSREVCAPCPHSKNCHRPTHACAEGVSADVVAMVASEVYGGRVFQLKIIAEEYADTVELIRVDMRSGGFWAAYSLTESFTEASVGRWIDLAAKKIWLDGSVSGAHERMGSESLQLARLLKTIHSGVSEIEWRHLFADFEKQAAIVEGRINGFKVGLQYLKGCYEDPKRMGEFVKGLISFRERIRQAPLLRSFKVMLDEVIEDDISPAFTRFRRMNDLVSQIERRIDIQTRLVRALTHAAEQEKGIEKT